VRLVAPAAGPARPRSGQALGASCGSRPSDGRYPAGAWPVNLGLPEARVQL